MRRAALAVLFLAVLATCAAAIAGRNAIERAWLRHRFRSDPFGLSEPARTAMHRLIDLRDPGVHADIVGALERWTAAEPARREAASECPVAHIYGLLTLGEPKDAPLIERALAVVPDPHRDRFGMALGAFRALSKLAPARAVAVLPSVLSAADESTGKHGASLRLTIAKMLPGAAKLEADGRLAPDEREALRVAWLAVLTCNLGLQNEAVPVDVCSIRLDFVPSGPFQVVIDPSTVALTVDGRELGTFHPKLVPFAAPSAGPRPGLEFVCADPGSCPREEARKAGGKKVRVSVTVLLLDGTTPPRGRRIESWYAQDLEPPPRTN